MTEGPDFSYDPGLYRDPNYRSALAHYFVVAALMVMSAPLPLYLWGIGEGFAARALMGCSFLPLLVVMGTWQRMRKTRGWTPPKVPPAALGWTVIAAWAACEVLLIVLFVTESAAD